MPDSFHILSIVFLPSDRSSAACACDAEDGSVAVGCRDFWPLESGAGFLVCWRMDVSFLASVCSGGLCSSPADAVMGN